jgi:hypothetical protein
VVGSLLPDLPSIRLLDAGKKAVSDLKGYQPGGGEVAVRKFVIRDDEMPCKLTNYNIISF